MYHVFVQLPYTMEYKFGSYEDERKATKKAKKRYDFHNHYADVSIRDDEDNILYKHYASERDINDDKPRICSD